MAITAKYDGICVQECGNRIHPGDWIVRTDDGYRHLECEPAPEIRDDEKLCDVCWLIHPEGTCTA